MKNLVCGVRLSSCKYEPEYHMNSCRCDTLKVFFLKSRCFKLSLDKYF